MAKKRALIIGINYAGTPNELGGCENDARDLDRRMSSAGVITDVITGHISAEAFFAALARYQATNRNADTLYICFSGHGTQIPGRKPGTTDEGICLFSIFEKIEVVRDNQINAAISTIAGSVFLYYDSCFSGGMDRTVQAPGMRKKFIAFDPEQMDIHEHPMQKAVRIPKPPKVYYLQACAKNEVSYDLGTNGMFTREFCKAYDGALMSRKNCTVKYLMGKAAAWCKGWQTPEYDIEGGRNNKTIF